MEEKNKELEKEKDFIILKASNYHYDLGIEHEKERIVGLIDEWWNSDDGQIEELKKRINK